MLFKFILYSILVYLALRLVRWILTPSASSPKKTVRRAKSSQMVRCNACGMFITKGSALMEGGGDFCSKTCYERKVYRA
jgi:hypothetical protein